MCAVGGVRVERTWQQILRLALGCSTSLKCHLRVTVSPKGCCAQHMSPVEQQQMGVYVLLTSLQCARVVGCRPLSFDRKVRDRQMDGILPLPKAMCGSEFSSVGLAVAHKCINMLGAFTCPLCCKRPFADQRTFCNESLLLNHLSKEHHIMHLCKCLASFPCKQEFGKHLRIDLESRYPAYGTCPTTGEKIEDPHNAKLRHATSNAESIMARYQHEEDESIKKQAHR